MSGEGAMCGRRASISFMARGGEPLPADVQQLVASARLVRDAMAPDFNAARLPAAQYKALHILHGALDRFPSLANPSPGRGPPGAGSTRDCDAGPAADATSEARA